MENQDQFYLTLPSSASMELHPDNKISDYTTELMNTIYLERDRYEVGLSEIIIDANVENVPDNDEAFAIYRSANYVKNKLKITNANGLHPINISGKLFLKEMFYTPRGRYRSLSELFGVFNAMFAKSLMCRDLIFNTTKVKGETVEIISLKSTSTINLQDMDVFYIRPYVWFERGIGLTNIPSSSSNNQDHENKLFLQLFRRQIPNFDEYLTQTNVSFFKAIHMLCDPEELLRDTGMAYVYTDIVEPQYVGDTMACLLRVIKFPKGRKVITFPNIHYLPLSKPQLNSVRIYIRDVEGDAYSFTKGSAVLKLHIRKKSMQ